MSLVGTRPILQDELLKYELHHRARIAIKPGITGMWQVSGRSDITDFEEVVRLDGIVSLLGKILTNILTALYEPFGFSLLLSFLAMFFYLYAYEPEEAGKGWKSAIVTWYQKFKGSVFFRKLFFLAFVMAEFLKYI